MTYLPADELIESGILQEANRTFFHMLGLALEVDREKGTLRLQDHREDMEGVAFENGALSADKYVRFLNYSQPRHEARLRGVGFVEQPFPDPDASAAQQEIPNAQEDGKPNLRLVVNRREPGPARPQRPDGHDGVA